MAWILSKNQGGFGVDKIFNKTCATCHKGVVFTYIGMIF
ncbi:hypothetical protein RB2501_12969 [Robiginitalea biformata HTCC2501]|uniref:Uncharacterized protein n=1 Tax=Robiginitalea biformata (strain ATCC BAA-864 / DSM 15991 / KCTC 12146 / HTCC2501) TaxID=313596 RepID=A4CK41_ROBBH|nr:hypothetical protein RB2501_12969 [Robiginitalea biformata HTCC2501]